MSNQFVIMIMSMPCLLRHQPLSFSSKTSQTQKKKNLPSVPPSYRPRPARTSTPEQVKDCLVYLRLAANPHDTLAMRRAINTPARGIGPKTVQALEALATSALKELHTLEGITLPECLMSLLERSDLEELETVLMRGFAAAGPTRGVPGAPARDDKLGEGAGAWPEGGETKEYDAVMAASVGEDDGWAGFSVPRVRLLMDVMSSSSSKASGKKDRARVMIEGPTKAQADKLKSVRRGGVQGEGGLGEAERAGAAEGGATRDRHAQVRVICRRGKRGRKTALIGPAQPASLRLPNCTYAITPWKDG